jgi:DNA-binding CsgD family transcriptional regulator
MLIYNGPHLIITFEKDYNRFLNSWKSSPTNVKKFKKEMLEYLFALERINPSQIIWLQQNFIFQIDDKTKTWVENNIMKPRFEAGHISQSHDGFHHIAFVLGKDILTHIKVMAVFDEKSRSVFRPKHFATEKDAVNWLNSELLDNQIENEIEKQQITFKGIDKDGKAIIEFKKNASEINQTIKLFRSIIEENDFLKNNIEKYSSLSKREKETLKFIIKGFTNHQISERMSISSNTVRTHRNRIWKKLDIRHYRDCIRYQCFLN